MSHSIDLPPGPFATVLADPPWPYDDALDARRRGAARHYSLMSLDDIKAMPVAAVAADNAHLYLCAPNSFIDQAFEVMEAWGFKYKTKLTWVKMTKDGSRLRIGMGHYFRNCTEDVLFGVRGRLPLLARNLPNVFHAPRTSHSTKPDELYNLASAASPGPRLELFARSLREGWAGWGDQYPGGQSELR